MLYTTWSPKYQRMFKQSPSTRRRGTSSMTERTVSRRRRGAMQPTSKTRNTRASSHRAA